MGVGQRGENGREKVASFVGGGKEGLASAVAVQSLHPAYKLIKTLPVLKNKHPHSEITPQN